MEVESYEEIEVEPDEAEPQVERVFMYKIVENEPVLHIFI